MDSNPGMKFRPQQLHRKFSIKHSNWQPRSKWSPKDYLLHVFSMLHYKSRHAPRPIQIKWRKASTRFERQHHKII